MKKLVTLFLLSFSSFALFSCDPLNKKYDKEKYSEVISENADSVSRSAFNRATVENEINDIRNEDFTYQELIDQGKAIQKKEQTNKNVVR
ncbi:hypothetical protein [Larkinella knui]|uniref:DUF4296 domain-containing protein n=1 Tax=Larkinella knui TaxID=2025310 RepID=A0A3P1CWH8_9BACT|nr:hypothetical protein [Larkinella knui]RRB17701.1 hypothetical protein EHT87_05315 [Larkinella knui]